MKVIINFFIFGIFILCQSIAYAQIPTIEQGSLIRVTSTKYLTSPIIGEVKKISSDSLSLFVGNRLVKLSAIEIVRIDTREKLTRHTTEGVLIGAVPTAFIVGALFPSFGSDESSYGPNFTKGESAVMGAVMGAFSGGLIGGLIGHSKITKDWQQVYPEKRLLGSVPGEKSPFLAGTMSFILPGLGQYYNGDTRKGIIQNILYISGIVLIARSSGENTTQKLLGCGLAIGSALWSVIDAPLSANKKNKLLIRQSSKNLLESEESINLSWGISYTGSALCVESSYRF